MQEKNVLSYMSPNEQSLRRTHSTLGWISLACPVLLMLFIGSCFGPLGWMNESSGISVLASLIGLGTIVSTFALIEASRHERRKTIPKATLFFYLVILWLTEVVVTL